MVINRGALFCQVHARGERSKNFSDREAREATAHEPGRTTCSRYRDKDRKEYLGAFRKLRGGLALGDELDADGSGLQGGPRRHAPQPGPDGYVSLRRFSRLVFRPLDLAAGAAAGGCLEPDRGGPVRARHEERAEDELGLLTESFVQMGRGLAERERVKETFGKFVNKHDRRAGAQGGELRALGGARKTATSSSRTFSPLVYGYLREALARGGRRVPQRLHDADGRVHRQDGRRRRQVHRRRDHGRLGSAGVRRAARAKTRWPRSGRWCMMRHTLVDFNKGRGGDPASRSSTTAAARIPALHRRPDRLARADGVHRHRRRGQPREPHRGPQQALRHRHPRLGVYRTTSFGTRSSPRLCPPIKVKGKADPLTDLRGVVKLKGDEGPETLAELRCFLGIKPPEAEVDVDKEEVKYEVSREVTSR